MGKKAVRGKAVSSPVEDVPGFFNDSVVELSRYLVASVPANKMSRGLGSPVGLFERIWAEPDTEPDKKV